MKKILLFSLLAVLAVGMFLFSATGQDAMRDVFTVRGLFTSAGTTVLTPHTLTATNPLTIPYGTVFLMSTATHIDSINPAGVSGTYVVIVTTTTDTLLDGKNLKLTSDFQGTADDVICLVAYGSNWYEISRSAN